MPFFTSLRRDAVRDGTTLTAEQISLLVQTSSPIDASHDGKLTSTSSDPRQGSQSQLQSLLEIFTFTATRVRRRAAKRRAASRAAAARTTPTARRSS